MDVREKLIEILRKPIFPNELVDPTEAVSDYLLDNGVTVQEWIPVTERFPDLEIVDAKCDDFDLYACLVTVKNFMAKNGERMFRMAPAASGNVYQR